MFKAIASVFVKTNLELVARKSAQEATMLWFEGLAQMESGHSVATKNEEKCIVVMGGGLVWGMAPMQAVDIVRGRQLFLEHKKTKIKGYGPRTVKV